MSNCGRGRGQSSPQKQSPPKSKNGNNNNKGKGVKNKIGYKLGNSDKWVGNPNKEEDYVVWALIDNDHKANPAFNNIENIESKLQELEQIVKFVEQDINKQAIEGIIDKWQLQLKDRLLDKQNNTNKEDANIIEDNDTEAMDVDYVQDNNKKSMEKTDIIDLSGHNDTQRSSNTPKSNNTEEKASSFRKSNIGILVITQEMNTTHGAKPTMVEVLKMKATKQTLLPNNGSIRVCLSFKSAIGARNDTNIANEIRRILIRIMEIGSQFDHKLKILLWISQGTNTLEPISRYEAITMVFDKLKSYINMPNGHTPLMANKMCHGFGVNLKTDEDINTFIDKWNQVKFKLGSNKDKGWISIKRSEVQKYHKAYPVGFFQGSSETGVYKILNKELPKVVGVNLEVLFQNIYQCRVTGQFWEFAKTEAKKQGNKGSKEFRSRIFSLAPSGLIAYVYKESNINIAFKQLVKHYRKQTPEKAWPVLPDGSRMRFISMVAGLIRNTRVRNQLSSRIKWRITAKALEEVLDLPLKDMFTDHEYFGGKSLAFIMQGILSKETEGASIFRHITRKWNSNPEMKEYQITAHHYMRNEANKFLKNMELFLRNNYGEASLQHMNYGKKEYSKTGGM